MTRVLRSSCDIILPVAILKLLRVLLEPALLVTSSLGLVWVVADSSTAVAGSSITIVSSISVVITSISWSWEPGTLQIYTLSHGMITPAVFGMFRAWNPQYLIRAWSTTLVST